MTFHTTAWVPTQACPTQDFKGYLDFRSHLAGVTGRIPGGGGHDGYAFHVRWTSLTIEEARALREAAEAEAHVRTYIEVWKDGSFTFLEGKHHWSPRTAAARAWGCKPEETHP